MSLMSKVALMLANFNRSLCRLAELPPRSHAPCDSPHGGRTSKCLSCWGCFPSPQGPYTRVPSHHLSLLTTHLNKLSGELGALWHEVTCLLIEKYGKYDWKYVNVNMLVHLCWMCFWFFSSPLTESAGAESTGQCWDGANHDHHQPSALRGQGPAHHHDLPQCYPHSLHLTS